MGAGQDEQKHGRGEAKPAQGGTEQHQMYKIYKLENYRAARSAGSQRLERAGITGPRKMKVNIN
ncbi:hypothetical protein WME75_30855 [Sorangium sp. So ce1014]|uniref:hypothetical protein n=1 Tax=Sorangium sp. So ce1014 TaxID=3133326 RepID=UPI003F6445D8